MTLLRVTSSKKTMLQVRRMLAGVVIAVVSAIKQNRLGWFGIAMIFGSPLLQYIAADC